jgi:hypothetical protein
MITKYPILWLELWADCLFSFRFNIAVCEEESVSDMFICKVIHQDFLISSFGRHCTSGRSRPCEAISSIQSLSYPSTDWAISIFHQSCLVSSCFVSCHRPFLPGTSLEPTVIPTTQASSFRLLYFVYSVWCSEYSCFFVLNLLNVFPGVTYKFFLKPFVNIWWLQLLLL